MKIIISGGTGLIGHALIPKLILAGHQLSILGRNKDKIEQIYTHTAEAITWDKLADIDPNAFDIIINLTGENIADHRWSSKTKSNILSSRINTTTQLVNWALQANQKKPHLYNALRTA